MLTLNANVKILMLSANVKMLTLYTIFSVSFSALTKQTGHTLTLY
jgi:hypothetical protein